MGRWASVADVVDPPNAHWASEPGKWAQDRGVFLWSKQVEVLDSLVVGNTAVHSCHSAGKSRGAATAAVWWIDAHPPGDAFVITSAPTDKQVKAILWRELNKMHAELKLPGRMNIQDWYLGNELVAFGRKPSDYDEDAFQGIHAQFVLVILDEACGMTNQLWTAADTIASNEGSRILAIGNPDDPHSHFADVCKSRFWRTIHIGAKDTPNFTGEEVPEKVGASLLAKSWTKRKKVEWGEKSALYISKVLGLFPSEQETEFDVIPLSFVSRCLELAYPAGSPREAGLDFGASSGGDQTVLRERRGAKVGRVHRWREADPMKLVGEIVVKLNEWGVDRLKCDSIGVGHGCSGRLQELSRRHHPTLDEPGMHAAEVVRVNVSEKSNYPSRFFNLRAELWWEVGRENSRLQLWDLSEAASDEDELDALVAELTTPRYEILDSRGRIKVELKKHIIERLGRSPDDADALLLAFYSPHGVVSATEAAQVLASRRIPGVSQR